MTYAEELVDQGLLPIRTLAEYREAFARWGLPMRWTKDPDALPFGGPGPDRAVVFVDDEQDGRPMAVVVDEDKIQRERLSARQTRPDESVGRAGPFGRSGRMGAHEEPTMYARPTWDAQGFDAMIVLRREFRSDLPGIAWTAWVTYGPAMTRVDLGDVAGQLTHAKAETSRRAREHHFVPKGLWHPVYEEMD